MDPLHGPFAGTYAKPGIGIVGASALGVPSKMERIRALEHTGVPMRDKGFFTYARAHHGLDKRGSSQFDKEQSTGIYFEKTSHQYNKDWRHRNYGKALVFEPSFFGASIHEQAASIAGLPFMDGLFEHGVMVTRYRLLTPRGTGSVFTMVAATDPTVFPEKIGQLAGDLFFFWKENGLMRRAHVTFDEILSSCISIERVVGNCERCTKDFRDCFVQRFDAWLEQQEGKNHIFKILHEANTIDQMDTDDLDEFFKEHGDQKTWTFISPGRTAEAFATKLRDVSDHQMWDLESLAEERSERAQKAVETKRALRVCHDDCILFGTCEAIGTRYKRGAFRCQNGNLSGYYSRSKQGPYTKGMLETAQVQLFQKASPDWLPRKHIELIAANSGLETRLLGPRMQLVGLQPDMKTVKFREKLKSYAEHTLSFEDAVNVCRLPYWYGGSYEHPGFSEPRVEMSDAELLLYYEICQRDTLKGYNYYCGHTEPIIMDIDWRPGSKSFGVTGHAGWTCTVQSIKDMEPVFASFPKVFEWLS